jgi:hypothetical protein
MRGSLLIPAVDARRLVVDVRILGHDLLRIDGALGGSARVAGVRGASVLAAMASPPTSRQSCDRTVHGRGAATSLRQRAVATRTE